MRNMWAVLGVPMVLVMTWGVAIAADCGEPTPAPKYQVGEKWTWRNEKGTESSDEVVQVEGDIAQIRWSNGDVAFYDKDRIIRKVVRANGEVLTKKGAGAYTTIGEKVLDFPLQVDKKWERSYFAAALVGGAGLQTYYERYRILRCEEISVPAGKLSVFKIEIEQSSAGSRFSGIRHSWYAPSVKNYVRTQYVPSQWWTVGRFLDSELIKFEVK